jgi:hypothetical protein
MKGQIHAGFHLPAVIFQVQCAATANSFCM